MVANDSTRHVEMTEEKSYQIFILMCKDVIEENREIKRNWLVTTKSDRES